MAGPGEKIDWYAGHKRAQELAVEVAHFVETFGTDFGAWSLNDYAWTVFTHTDDVGLLNRALGWSRRAIAWAVFWWSSIHHAKSGRV